MSYFATALSVTLGGLRLRIRIDFDDDVDDRPAVRYCALDPTRAAAVAGSPSVRSKNSSS